MIDVKFNKSMEFILELDKLKSVFRRSKLINDDRYENDAEHSWHICIMAHTLYPFFEGTDKAPDISRAVKMLLLHDIVEVYAGDTYCYDDEAGQDKLDRELAAADKIFGLLPDDAGGEFKSLWMEFDEEKTADAVFAATMDRVQPLLLNYANNGEPWVKNGITKSQVLKRMDVAINRSIPPIRDYVLHIIEDSTNKGYLKNE